MNTQKNNEFKSLDLCLKMIESSLTWGSSENWTNYNFEKLSEYIYEKTSVSISTSTLKRMFGKVKTYKDRYNPHFSSKDALAQYLGFQHWEDFKNKNSAPQSLHQKNRNSVPLKNIFTGNKTKIIYLSALLLAAAVILFYAFTTTNVNIRYLSDAEINQIKFEGKTRGNPPFTAQFEYDVSMFPKDSFFLYDAVESTYYYLDPAKHSKNVMYYMPERYYVQLTHYQRPLKTLYVDAYSQGWEVFAKIIPEQPDKRISVNYRKIEPNKERIGTELNVDFPDILNQGLDTSKLLWVQYRLVQDFPLSLDSLTLNCKIKHHQEHRGHINSQVQIFLHGDDNQSLTMLFSEPCCFLYSALVCSEKSYTGKDENMKNLGIDFSDFRSIGIITASNKATFTADDEQIFYTGYEKPLGKLRSVIVAFRGAGGVLGELDLRNSKGEIVYKTDF